MTEKVLVVGAGPTGLVTALWLTHLGIPVRIIDKDSSPGETSRAMAVHARTLEFYQQIGMASDAVARGINVEDINVRKNGAVVASVHIGPIGKDISPFPFVLSFPQDDHEKLLIEYLEKAGVTVERNTELTSFTQDENGVQATLNKQNNTETMTTPYLLGCDGARSVVRTQLGFHFPGGTYLQKYYVADVMATGDVVNDYMQLCLTGNDFSLAFPIRSSGSIRLIGIVPKNIENKVNLEFADIAPIATSEANISISKLNWFSTYHSHHRVAEHFRHGRAFLLGDAGHIHSPVGGQGMNTGIGDAINLAWKIAAVMQNRAASTILDSYEIERIAFARKLVATTDTVFQAVTNEGWIGKLCRNGFFPHILPFFIRYKAVRNLLFRTVSQTRIHYRQSFLSRGFAGKVKGGDRLPWVRNDTGDNFKVLESLDWQIHIYGQANQEFKNSLSTLGFKLHEFTWNDYARQAGVLKNAVYLVRPDGYVAYANMLQDAQSLKNYLADHKITPRA